LFEILFGELDQACSEELQCLGVGTLGAAGCGFDMR
jgi:hypothetical protein